MSVFFIFSSLSFSLDVSNLMFLALKLALWDFFIEKNALKRFLSQILLLLAFSVLS